MIQLEDFESIQIELAFTNLTSKTDFMPKDLGESVGQIVEFLDRGLVLAVPIRSCAVGHALNLFVMGTRPGGERFQFEAGVKVDRVEPTSESEQQIEVSLAHFDQSSWESLCGLFNHRQEEIERFLQTVKG